MAKIPPNLQEINSRIPQVVSNIVMKLMAKNPQDRYQSAAGLIQDLEICLNQLSEFGEIRDFELGQKDRCTLENESLQNRLTIPDKLYGRETEMQILLDSFERVSQGNTESILVAGSSGVGKTALVNEVYKPALSRSSKFPKIIVS